MAEPAVAWRSARLVRRSHVVGVDPAELRFTLDHEIGQWAQRNSTSTLSWARPRSRWLVSPAGVNSVRQPEGGQRAVPRGSIVEGCQGQGQLGTTGSGDMWRPWRAHWFRQDQRRFAFPASWFRLSLAWRTLAAHALLLAVARRPPRGARLAIFPLQAAATPDRPGGGQPPDGYGSTLWLETTHHPGACWPAPLAAGWDAAVQRATARHVQAPGCHGARRCSRPYGAPDVRQPLRANSEALCETRAPRSRWDMERPAPPRWRARKVEPLAAAQGRGPCYPIRDQVRQQEELAPSPTQSGGPIKASSAGPLPTAPA